MDKKDAYNAFKTKYVDDWSCYKDHEKRELAFNAGWEAALKAWRDLPTESMVGLRQFAILADKQEGGNA